MTAFTRPIAVSALILGGFALVGALWVTSTEQQTRSRIQHNARAELLRALAEVVDPARYDNAIDTDTIRVSNSQLLGAHGLVTVYRARSDGAPVAVLLEAVAPNGYSGAIKLLVGINVDGSVSGVRVTDHHETPGLGDAIDATRSDWVEGFVGRSLQNPGTGGWRVKKDGGEFDQFTGATVTPRAVVGAVHKALQYYRDKQGVLFTESADESAK